MDGLLLISLQFEPQQRDPLCSPVTQPQNILLDFVDAKLRATGFAKKIVSIP
jgi:hypothetical protein